MKKGNWRVILNAMARFLLYLLIGDAIMCFVMYVLFKDTNVFDLLFSSESTAEVALFLIITNIFSIFLGIIITAMQFINSLMEKDEQLKNSEQTIQHLHAKLVKISKKYASSPADRVFGEIEGEDDYDDKMEDSFKTLQEEMKAKHNIPNNK